MRINLKDLESNVVNTSLEVHGQEIELEDVFSGIGIKTDQGTFGIAQRDGGIEVLLNGQPVFQSTTVLIPVEFEGEGNVQVNPESNPATLLDKYRNKIATMLHDYFNKADFADPGTRNEAAQMILRLMLDSTNK